MVKQVETDVLVVGAGPAGLAAAVELRRLGTANVLVVDRERQAGGVPRHCHHIGFGLRDMRRLLTGPTYAQRWVKLAQQADVTIRTETTITGWKGETVLTATSPDGLLEYRASAVVLATGCRERPRSARLIPGDRPAGVFTTGALQRYVYEHHHPVGKRAVVVGADHVGFSSVLTLKHAGLDVIAMITEWPRHQSFLAYKLLSADRYRVPIHTNMRVTNILGKRRVEAVVISDVRDDSSHIIECDTVVFTGDWIPDYELSYCGNLEIDQSSRSPLVDLRLATSVPGVFAAGNLIHAAETADVAALSGRHVAQSVVEFLRGNALADQPPVPIELEPPIKWISPHVIRIGQRHSPMRRFTIRVSEHRENSGITVWQGGQTLYERRFRRLIPNLPFYIPDSWIRQVQANGDPLRIRLR
jgi:thioredoxin reductase